MRKSLTAEKLIIEAISQKSLETKKACKGLSIGKIIKMLRLQLGIPQKILSKKSSVRQATISQLEQEKIFPNLKTLKKILEVLGCDLVISFVLRESIDDQRLKQAQKKAKKHIEYLKGTMSLEKQPIDPLMEDEMMNNEINELLFGSNSKLWKD